MVIKLLLPAAAVMLGMAGWGGSAFAQTVELPLGWVLLGSFALYTVPGDKINKLVVAVVERATQRISVPSDN